MYAARTALLSFVLQLVGRTNTTAMVLATFSVFRITKCVTEPRTVTTGTTKTIAVSEYAIALYMYL